MKRSEIAEFIESMEEIGDNWTEEQVEDVYGDMSLKEALAGRKASVGRMTVSYTHLTLPTIRLV